MKKNVAGQTIGAELINATTGAAFTSTVTVYVTGDAGTQAIGSVGSGICTHEGNGFHTYAPAQAETNYNHVAFTFIGTGAIPATIQIFTSFPQTVDLSTGITAGTITTATNVTTVNGLAANVITAASIAADAITDAKVAADVTIASVTGAVGSVTGNVGGNVVGSVASVTGAVGSVTGAVGSVTGAVGSVAADVTLAASEENAIADAVRSRQLTEGYAADGVAPTLQQALFLIQQMLTEMSIAGTTMTVKKIDGTTTAATFTLNDAVTPTAITRAT